jgi:hypothetical protein
MTRYAKEEQEKINKSLIDNWVAFAFIGESDSVQIDKPTMENTGLKEGDKLTIAKAYCLHNTYTAIIGKPFLLKKNEPNVVIKIPEEIKKKLKVEEIKGEDVFLFVKRAKIDDKLGFLEEVEAKEYKKIVYIFGICPYNKCKRKLNYLNTFHCPYCHKYHCEKHRLPENHKCTGNPELPSYMKKGFGVKKNYEGKNDNKDYSKDDKELN